MPPSPTAAAQRFTEPERTSPAAKMPGRLVSKAPGGRLAPFQAGPSPTAAPLFPKPPSPPPTSPPHHLRPPALRRPPAGAGRRADHRKGGGRRPRAPPAGFRFPQLPRLEALPADHFANLGVAKNLDILRRLHPAGEVARHALGKIAAPDD